MRSLHIVEEKVSGWGTASLGDRLVVVELDLLTFEDGDNPIISCQDKNKILKKQLVREPLFHWTHYPLACKAVFWYSASLSQNQIPYLIVTNIRYAPCWETINNPLSRFWDFNERPCIVPPEVLEWPQRP